jgi:NADH:ubiquinone oxidoreductase subunit 6 (subunit J)
MENKNTQMKGSGIGIIDLFVVMLIGLKLANVIDWSWWWVLAWWWVQLVIAGGFYVLISVVDTLDHIARAKSKNK